MLFIVAKCQEAQNRNSLTRQVNMRLHREAAFLCLLLVSFSCQALADQPPLIQKFSGLNNHQIVIETSTSISLDCTAKGSPEPEIEWFKDDSTLTNGVEGLKIKGLRNQTLEFEKASAETHVGYYHCQASNRLGVAKSEVILVTEVSQDVPDIAELPTFKEQPEVEIKAAGDSATFKCVGGGEPEPDIIWSKNGKVLADRQNESHLTIERINTDDIATYACNISNIYGYDYKVVYLDILNQQPIITETPRNQTVSIGQEVILRCAAKGYPSPTIRWTFNGKPTTEFEGMTVSTSGDLNVKRITSDHGDGQFNCLAENIHGVDEASARLVVVSTTTIQYGPVDTIARVRNNAQMNCTILWDPNYELQVDWKKDNVDLKIDGTKFIKDENHSLLITNLSLNDTGIYTCVATTKMGSATDSGTLEVKGIPPTLIQGPQEQTTISEGSDIELLCKVEGFPTPEHIWFKDTTRLNFTGERYEITSDGTLRIRQATVKDSAKYICRANNGNEPPAVSSGFVDVRTKTKVLRAPEHVLFQQGGNVLFDCLVDVDPAINESVVVEWYLADKKLDLESSEEEIKKPDSGNMEYEDITTPEPSIAEHPKYSLMPNRSLLISSVASEDLGDYKCLVKTPIDEIVLLASLYTSESWLWVIILMVIIVCVLLLIILTLCILWIRRRAKRQGRYGVKDMENGKKLNRTDIHYSIDEDNDGKERSLLDPDKSGSTPIFTPKTLKQLSDITKGSENSLLNLTDEDLWLRKGMDEDGSFRGGYLDLN